MITPCSNDITGTEYLMPHPLKQTIMEQGKSLKGFGMNNILIWYLEVYFMHCVGRI